MHGLLSFSGFFDKTVKRKRSTEITFQSHVERECFFLLAHSFRETSQQQTVKIFTGTWNIGCHFVVAFLTSLGGAIPPSLDDWVPTSKGFDMIVVGVQVRALTKGQG
jgi:hypothetical protein